MIWISINPVETVKSKILNSKVYEKKIINFENAKDDMEIQALRDKHNRLEGQLELLIRMFRLEKV